MAQTAKSHGPRGRRERNPEQTRARILEAAEAEFARKGYDGARLRDVATAAGVHHALLHHYFGDKEGLFRAVVERAFAALSSEAVPLLEKATDPKALLELGVDLLVGFYRNNPNLVQILHFASLDDGSPAYDTCEEVGLSVVMPVLETTATVVERAQRAGTMRDDVDARRLVALAIGAAAHVFHEDRFFSRFLGDDVRSEDALAAHRAALVAMLGDALLRPPRGA